MGDLLLADSSGLLAALDRGERHHRAVLRLLQAEARPLVTIDFVLAEVDFLVLRRLGENAQRGFVRQVVEGAIVREAVSAEDLERAEEIGLKYHDQALGLTDCALMAVSERLGATEILTFDLRHFGLFRDSRGRALRLLPET
ncbi:MAG: PIN domain-containing protein [Myxococcales bacterium]|nr:PIN domain-containing protein [Myxococcales bacterium]